MSNDDPIGGVTPIPDSGPLQRGPGLAKAQRAPLTQRRSVRLAKLLDGWIARLLEQADVVSEGGVIDEPGGPVYYGSTSLRCRLEPDRLDREGLDEEVLVALVLADPYARVKLLRIAQREAVTRAGGSLDVAYAELRGSALRSSAGVDLAVEVDLNAAVVRSG